MHTVKWFQVWLCITDIVIKHHSFVYTQLNGQTVLFLTIQLSIRYTWERYENHEKGSQTFFVWSLIVHTWNSSSLQSNLLRLQCTCSTVPTTSGRLRGSPIVRAYQRPSSQPLSSPQLSHNDSLWAWGITKCHREQRLDYTGGWGTVLMPILVK